MNDDELDAIEARARAGTPDLFRGMGDAESLYHGDYALIAPLWPLLGHRVVWCQFNPHFVYGNDAELFVHARGDVLALVAEIRRLRAADGGGEG